MRNEATSAMGNAHQIRLALPFRLSSQAAGTSTKSWRTSETSSAMTPRPRAWNTAEETMLKPAMTKWMEMMRRATSPRASMSGPALKMLSMTPGQSCAAAKPSSMMATAATTAIRMTCTMRRGLRAP